MASTLEVYHLVLEVHVVRQAGHQTPNQARLRSSGASENVNIEAAATTARDRQGRVNMRISRRSQHGNASTAKVDSIASPYVVEGFEPDVLRHQVRSQEI
jgi:hypothetical protein